MTNKVAVVPATNHISVNQVSPKKLTSVRVNDLPSQFSSNKTIEEILTENEIVAAIIAASFEGGQVRHKKQLLEPVVAKISELVKEIIGEDYPRDWDFDDPDFCHYANIEKDRQRNRAMGWGIKL